MPGEQKRRCARCGQSKSIRGVWYLLPGAQAPFFTCETCWRTPLAGAQS